MTPTAADTVGQLLHGRLLTRHFSGVI